MFLIDFTSILCVFSPAALLVGFFEFIREKSARKTEIVNSLGSHFYHFQNPGFDGQILGLILICLVR